MDLGSWWIMDVIGPVLLLLALIWLILNVRSSRSVELKGRSKQSSRELDPEEERRRREGPDEF